MTATSAATTASNVLKNDTRKDDLITIAKDLGNAEGAGVNSRPELAFKVVEYARVGAIGTEDTADIWREFLAARASSKGDNRAKEDTANGGDPQKSFKNQVSKLNQFVIAGSLVDVDFGEVLARAKSYIDSNPALPGSTFDNMVTIARTQKAKEHKDKPLTDDEIKAALAPKDGDKELTELDYVTKVYNDLGKILNGTEGKDGAPGRPAFPSKEIEAAYQWVAQRKAALELIRDEARLNERKAKLSPAPIILPTPVTDEGNEHGTGEQLEAAE